MPQDETTKLVLWDKEPLMRLLAKRLTPVSFGICFFVFVSLPLCILAKIYQPGFFGNISWSISIVFLFPITTSGYSKAALEYAENLNGSTNVVLIDGSKLAEYIYDYGLGMQTEQTVIVKRMDSDFWEKMQDDESV